ncbi:hypothetical protein ACH5RR_024853 [Cinchona calisaya]|uniref:Sey1/RHD3-like three-helix bundle domain-containing protein n=1 Tax=Cinchona calisaya TaxID=153742 RepID=A0ABD2YXY4_9GENT
MIEILTLVDSISKKYDIDKKRDSIVSGDDSFTCLYATVESDIEATIVNLLFVQWMFLFDHQTDGDVAFACLDATVESDIEAALQSLKLSVVEEIRLDDEVDNIEKTLSVALLDGKGGASTNKSLGSLLVSKYLDDTAFENQSALFALAVSDIVPINMFHDIGRQQAANKLLVKTVFRALLENLEPVLREELEPVLREDIQKVEVVALSSFEEKEEQFKEQVLVWNNSSGFLWEAVPVLYDAEANYFDEGVRTGKRKQLEEKLLQLVQPAFQLMLGHIWSGTLERFKEAFNDALNGGKGFAITARRCTETSISQLEEWLSQRQKKKLGGFSALFSHDTDSMLRVWTWKEDIRAITKTARSSALKLLSVMEAIHLDDVVDNIEKTLSLVLLDSKDVILLDLPNQVPPTKTLITSVQCKSLWGQFKTANEYPVTQAIAAQQYVLSNTFWWRHDMGHQQAANRPLLKTVFQTPLENLETVLQKDIQKMWNSVPKPQAHKETLQVNFLMLKF